MAITVLPPVPLDSGNQTDIATLSNLLLTISGILDRESAIVALDRQMSDEAIASLNQTFIDASDRIDATINPAALT